MPERNSLDLHPNATGWSRTELIDRYSYGNIGLRGLGSIGFCGATGNMTLRLTSIISPPDHEFRILPYNS